MISPATLHRWAYALLFAALAALAISATLSAQAAAQEYQATPVTSDGVIDRNDFTGFEDLVAFTFFNNDFDTRTQGLDFVANARLYPIEGGTTRATLAINYTETEVTDVGETISATRVRQLEEFVGFASKVADRVGGMKHGFAVQLAARNRENRPAAGESRHRKHANEGTGHPVLTANDAWTTHVAGIVPHALGLSVTLVAWQIACSLPAPTAISARPPAGWAAKAAAAAETPSRSPPRNPPPRPPRPPPGPSGCGTATR